MVEEHTILYNEDYTMDEYHEALSWLFLHGELIYGNRGYITWIPVSAILGYAANEDDRVLSIIELFKSVKEKLYNMCSE